MVELVNLTDIFCESSIPSFWQFLRSPYFVFWRSFPKICGNIFISFTWGLFLSPSCEDTCFSPILETFQLNSIGIVPPPHSSTMIHLLVEGGKKPFLRSWFLFPDGHHLHHLAGTATKEGSGVNPKGNNLVKETRLAFLSQFCRLGPADREEARGPPSWSLAWVTLYHCHKGSQVS